MKCRASSVVLFLHRAFRLLTIIALLLPLFPAHPCMGQQSRETVRIATLDNYYPYCFRIPGSRSLPAERIEPGEDSSQLTGFSWDLVRTALHGAGYSIELYVAPWARVEHYIRNGVVDIVFPTLITPARSTIFVFSRTPIDSVNIVIYANAPVTAVPETMNELAGMKIGVMRDWSFGPMWEKTNNVTRHPVDSIRHAFQMLAKERVDAVIGYEKSFDHTLAQTGDAGIYWKSPVFETLHGYLAAKASAPFPQNVIAAFDRQIQELRQSGEIDKLAKNWSVPAPETHDAAP